MQSCKCACFQVGITYWVKQISYFYLGESPCTSTAVQNANKMEMEVKISHVQQNPIISGAENDKKVLLKVL